jgi:integrase
MSSSASSAPRLHDIHVATCRRRGFALSIERTYWRWIVRYVRFHDTRHPRKMGPAEMRAFLSHLATERDVASTTQNQALCALVFLYEQVLEEDVGEIGDFARAKPPDRLPTVLARREVKAMLEAMHGTPRLVASLLYGTGLRLAEGLRLRVKDLDFEQSQLYVRRGKGKDRLTMLPPLLHKRLRQQLGKARAWHGRRPGGRVRKRVSSEGALAQVSECAGGMGVAVGLSVLPTFDGSAFGCEASASPLALLHSAAGK